MRMKKFVSAMMAVTMVTGVFFSGFGGSTVQAAENTNGVSIPEMDSSIENSDISHKMQSAAQNDTFTDVVINESEIVPFTDAGHNTANTALYLDSSYMGSILSDSASDLENWYFFNVSETNKISTVLEQPSANSDYDIYLYKYSDDGTLSLISYSINSGSSMENLSAVAQAGYYFLRVVPEAAATTEGAAYNFMISLIGTFDACEPDDIPAFAVEYTDTINVDNTLDNIFDQDWSKLTVSSNGTYVVSMSNIPSGNTYNVCIYDSSFNFVAGMSCSGNKAGTVNLTPGTYYINVDSATGYSETQSYNLKVIKKIWSYATVMITNSGHIVELSANALYVNGKPVDMNWKYYYTVNYTRKQDVETSLATSFKADYLKNGTYRGPQSVSSDDCIAVYMDNFTYTYFCRYPGAGADYDFINQPFGSGEYILFYVDAVTGKVIDTEINYYYLSLGMKQVFTEFN